jgi:hypothetical protein
MPAATKLDQNVWNTRYHNTRKRHVTLTFSFPLCTEVHDHAMGMICTIQMLIHTMGHFTILISALEHSVSYETEDYVQEITKRTNILDTTLKRASKICQDEEPVH